MASELDDLRLFIQNRLQRAAPTLDVAAGSPADVEFISPLLTRLGPDPYNSDIVAFITGRLAAEFPELVLQPGEPIDDYAVKIMRILLEPFRRQINRVMQNQSMADPSLLNDNEADNLAANFFQRRRLGGFSVGVARAEFSAPQYMLITPSNAFVTASGLRFLPVENQSITAENMIFNTDGNLFYIDVVVRAEQQGSQYNIDKNTLVSIEGVPSAVKVTNLAKFEEGGDREDTTQFLARVEQSLTEKSLVTTRGIRARLLELLESIRSISVIGYQDPEMKRDILTGSAAQVFAFAECVATTVGSTISLFGATFVDGDAAHTDFSGAGVAVGDIFTHIDPVTKKFTEYTVTDVLSPVQVQVTPAPPDIITAANFFIKSRTRGSIYISDIPGGILVPQTRYGEVVVENNKVHIGGAVDVYIRAAAPSERSIIVPSLRDGEPLHFGVDLESFGGDADVLVQITPIMSNRATTTAAFAGPGDASFYIQEYDSGDGSVPWRPTEEDVDRYLQIDGLVEWGTHKITGVEEESILGGKRVRRVTVSIFDEDTQANQSISNHSGVFNISIRLVEKASVKNRVRDRAYPAADFNGNLNGVGAKIGDSVIIESGGDAGIYSVRRILTSLSEDDTLVLDRDLGFTMTPSGTGNASGLRYRIADSVQLDLVAPRAVKIPLGVIFPGGDLTMVAGSITAYASGTSNFLLAGVEAGDTLEVLEGSNKGLYKISAVFGGSIELESAPPSSGFQLSFTIYRAFTGVDRPLVRVKSVELLDSSNLSTGIYIPYGKVVDTRITGRLSNRSQGQVLESFLGVIPAGAPPLITINDSSVDFVAKGVTPAYRVEVFDGLNIGEYEVATVATNSITIKPASVGGKDLVVADTDVHYRVGQPSTGIARLYFLNPTSVEIDTGLSGGRLEYTDGNVMKTFRFSEVTGRTILPAPGSGDPKPRDLRVVRSYPIGGGEFKSILEITDPLHADVFGLELTEGDIFEVHEPIYMRDMTATVFEDLGVFGTPAGLHTIAGSSTVFVPDNSRIDFTQMGDLAGQTLYIDSGPDAGEYTIRSVRDSKTLILEAVLTTTTADIKGKDTSATGGSPVYDAELQVVGSDVYLRDPTDYGQLGVLGDYVTIFEAKDPAIEGTYLITGVDPGNLRVKLQGLSPVTVAPGDFSWFRTAASSINGTIHQAFSVYETAAKEVQVTEVATKAPDVTALRTTGFVQAGLVTMQDLTAGAFTGVNRGDHLEILKGANRGVYPILSAATNLLTIYSAMPFQIPEPSVTYRIWSGIYGSRRMITVANFEGPVGNGKVLAGKNIPYVIRRNALFRSSSTEMTENIDGGLYYVDMQIESLGPGDDRNLVENTPLGIKNGVRVDGYTYTVENETLTFSPYEQVTLNFTRRFLPEGNSDLPENHTEITGRNILIRYDVSQTTKLVDDLFHGDNDRPVNANGIAKHVLPSYVLTTLSYSGGSSVEITGPEVENYINYLTALDDLEVSDIEAFLTRRGATSVRHPITLVVVTHDLSRNLVVRRSVDKIGADSAVFNGTARISAYFAKLGEGLVVQRTS